MWLAGLTVNFISSRKPGTDCSTTLQTAIRETFFQGKFSSLCSVLVHETALLRRILFLLSLLLFILSSPSLLFFYFIFFPSSSDLLSSLSLQCTWHFHSRFFYSSFSRLPCSSSLSSSHHLLLYLFSSLYDSPLLYSPLLSLPWLSTFSTSSLFFFLLFCFSVLYSHLYLFSPPLLTLLLSSFFLLPLLH